MSAPIASPSQERKLHVYRASVAIAFRSWLAILLLSITMAVCLGGCGKKEEAQKGQLTPDLEAGRSGELSEMVTMKPGEGRSLTVIFFQNRSRDRELNWLSKGVAEMLAISLSQTPSLKVPSTEHVYRALRKLGKEDPLAIDRAAALDIARELKSDVVVTGSFTLEGELVTIEAELLEAFTGKLITAEKVEGAGLKDIFSMVDRLSGSIVEGLNVSPAEVAAVRPLTELSTSSVDALEAFAQGMEQLWGNDLIKAMKHFQRAVETDSTFALAFAIMAIHWHSFGSMDRARPMLEKALSLQDRLPPNERLMVLAMDAQLKGKDDVAIMLYEKLLQSTPQVLSAGISLGLAQVYYGGGQYEEAKRIYREILIQNPSDVRAHFMLASVYLVQEMTGEAEAELKEILRLRPDMLFAHIAMGQIHLSRGQYGQAEPYMIRAAQLDPENVRIANSLGYIYLYQEKYDQALETFKRLVTLAPDDPNSYDSLGEGFFRKGDLVKAEREYVHAIKLNPRFASPHYMLGIIYRQKGQTQKASEHLQEFLRLESLGLRADEARKIVKELEQG